MRVVASPLFPIVLLACILVCCTMAQQTTNPKKQVPPKTSEKTRKTLEEVKKTQKEASQRANKSKGSNEETVGRKTFKFNVYDMLTNSVYFFVLIAFTHYIIVKNCVAFYHSYKRSVELKSSPTSSSSSSSSFNKAEEDVENEEDMMPGTTNNDPSLVQRRRIRKNTEGGLSVDTSENTSSDRSASRSRSRSRRSSARVYAENTVTPPSSTRSNSRSTSVQNASRSSKPRGRSASRSPKQNLPVYAVGTKFYVKLITWYTRAKDCPFPNAEDWYVEGFVKSVGNKGMHDIVFPVFNDRETLTMKPSYFQRHAIFDNPTRVVTKKDLDEYDKQ